MSNETKIERTIFADNSSKV